MENYLQETIRALMHQIESLRQEGARLRADNARLLQETGNIDFVSRVLYFISGLALGLIWAYLR